MTYAKNVAIAMLAGGLLIGCHSEQSDKPVGDGFFPQGQRAIYEIAEAHHKAGARSDGMLQPCHFDGEMLNSLGEAKLDLMIMNDPESVTTVYLNFPETDMMNQRRDAIVAYMKDKGVEETHMKFVSGPNPATLSPTAGNLARMDRTESTATGGDQSGSMLPAPMGAGSSEKTK